MKAFASAPAQHVLGLFAKEPRPGFVKTRLATETSAEWAAKVADAFLQDTLDRFASLDCRRVVVFDPPTAKPYFARLASGRFTLTPQRGGDLGQRLASFFGDQLADGATSVLAVGTDSPTVPVSYVEQAFEQLQRHDVALGPATDGGYYLLGCRRLLPIFDGIAWSSSVVLRETIARLTNPAWSLAMLPLWYDVDTLDDWQMLRGHIAAMRRAGLDPGVPRVERLEERPRP
jgi:rSAM/selenodomain-associated transferase 1